jgi:hypothetical protein
VRYGVAGGMEGVVRGVFVAEFGVDCLRLVGELFWLGG